MSSVLKNPYLTPNPLNKKDPIMGSLFSKPKVPDIPPPAPMPTGNDEAVRRARKNAIAAASQRGGRASTILTDTASNDKLG